MASHTCMCRLQKAVGHIEIDQSDGDAPADNGGNERWNWDCSGGQVHAERYRR